MPDRVLDLVAEVLSSDAAHLRADLTDRIVRGCGCTREAAKDAVRDLLEARVIDPVTVCYYRASDARVVMEGGVMRGPAFPAFHATGA